MESWTVNPSPPGNLLTTYVEAFREKLAQLWMLRASCDGRWFVGSSTSGRAISSLPWRRSNGFQFQRLSAATRHSSCTWHCGQSRPVNIPKCSRFSLSSFPFSFFCHSERCFDSENPPSRSLCVVVCYGVSRLSNLISTAYLYQFLSSEFHACKQTDQHREFDNWGWPERGSIQIPCRRALIKRECGTESIGSAPVKNTANAGQQ